MPNPPRPISSAPANPAALNSATAAEPTSRCVGKGSLSILLSSEHRSDDKPSPQGMDAQSDPDLPQVRPAGSVRRPILARADDGIRRRQLCGLKWSDVDLDE